MATYALVEVSINDPDGMAPYIEKVSDTITAYGGKYLVRGGDPEILEGGLGEHPLKVVLEFPNRASAKQWYDSAEYQAILPARLKSSEGNFLLIDGV